MEFFTSVFTKFDITAVRLLLFVVALSANVVLIVVTLQYASVTRSRHLFVLFLSAQVLWISTNYALFLTNETYFLALTRATVFFAALHAFTFFLFIHTFLTDKDVLTKKLLIPLISFLVLVLIIILSPYTFVTAKRVGGTLVPEVGPGIAAFGSFVLLCIGWAFVSLIKKFRSATGIEKIQWKYLAIGLSFTFFLILAFSFLNFVLFRNFSTVQFGHLYTLPFIIFTTYAIARHQLLNIKAIVAELSVFLLGIILLIQLVTSNNTLTFITNGFVMIGVLCVGFFLIRGVLEEIRQRERLERLSKMVEATNKELKKLDQAKSEFISIASHQIRTPLTVIKGYISLALEGTLGPITTQTKESLGKAAFSTEQLVKLINELLDLSRIESGKITYVFVTNDLVKIINEVVDELTPQAKIKHIIIKKEIRQGMEQFIFDRDKIREIIINLLHNAVKYTAKGHIVIRAEVITKSPRNMVRFSIKDSGMGIDKKDIQKVFTKFGRTENARLVDPNGMGLGLYFVKKVAEDHGGTAWAESPGLGKGSTFIVEIPFKQ